VIVFVHSIIGWSQILNFIFSEKEVEHHRFEITKNENVSILSNSAQCKHRQMYSAFVLVKAQVSQF